VTLFKISLEDAQVERSERRSRTHALEGVPLGDERADESDVVGRK
jgi:hypothetical protein